MKKELTIREAKKEDLLRIFELIMELAAYENASAEVNIQLKDLEKEGFEDGNFKCFVADVNGKIEGMALAYFKFSSRKGRILYLEDLVVSESARGMGLGSALFGRVVKYGHENSVKRIEWVVSAGNKNAVQFYKNSGADIKTDLYTVYMDDKVLRKNIRE